MTAMLDQRRAGQIKPIGECGGACNRGGKTEDKEWSSPAVTVVSCNTALIGPGTKAGQHRSKNALPKRQERAMQRMSGPDGAMIAAIKSEQYSPCSTVDQDQRLQPFDRHLNGAFRILQSPVFLRGAHLEILSYRDAA
jgi:hypothetical protein